MRVKSNTTTRALLGSVMVLLLCTAMLVGTTFAWFTDTVNTVSTLQAGNLNVTLQCGTSKNDADGTWNYTDYDGTTGLQFLTPDGNLPTDENKVVWDAKHLTNEVQPLKLVNDGSLNLMCKVMLTGVTPIAAEQMTWKLEVDGTEEPFGKEFPLPAKTAEDTTPNELVLTLSGKLTNGDPLPEPVPTAQVVVCVRQAEDDEDAFGGDYDKGSRYQARVDAALVGTVTNESVEGSETGEIAPFVLNNALKMETQGAVTATIPAVMNLTKGTKVMLEVSTVGELATDSIDLEFDLQGVYDDTEASERTTWQFNVANVADEDNTTAEAELATLQLNVGRDMKSVTVNGVQVVDGTDSEFTNHHYQYDVNTGVLTLYLRADKTTSGLSLNS